MEELDAILNGVDVTIPETETVVAKSETTVITTQKQSQEAQEKFLINRDEEETKLTLEYARRMIALEQQIKEIKDDMAALKTEYKDDGVAVNKVNKAIKNIKMAMKLNDLDATEIEMIETVLSADVDIQTEIAQLVQKAN